MTQAPGSPRQPPRIIWMYWDQGESKAPFLIRTCMESWRRHNPEWDLRILDRSAYSLFPELDWLQQRPRISLQHRSDMLRLQLLMEKGGVWADATLFCTRPLDAWLPAFYADHFFAFSSIKPDREISNWFLAGGNQSKLLSRWRDTVFDFWKTRNFPQQSYWKRQLVRKLTSLRKRHLISNEIWFGHFMLERMNTFPYPVNMYLFDKLLHDSLELRALWNAREHFSDQDCEHLQKPLGMNNPVTDESKHCLATSTTPMYKLNWRQDKGKPSPGSNLEFLINQMNRSA